jgi:hypothetical protein
LAVPRRAQPARALDVRLGLRCRNGRRIGASPRGHEWPPIWHGAAAPPHLRGHDGGRDRWAARTTARPGWRCVAQLLGEREFEAHAAAGRVARARGRVSALEVVADPNVLLGRVAPVEPPGEECVRELGVPMCVSSTRHSEYTSQPATPSSGSYDIAAEHPPRAPRPSHHVVAHVLPAVVPALFVAGYLAGCLDHVGQQLLLFGLELHVPERTATLGRHIDDDLARGSGARHPGGRRRDYAACSWSDGGSVSTNSYEHHFRVPSSSLIQSPRG